MERTTRAQVLAKLNPISGFERFTGCLGFLRVGLTHVFGREQRRPALSSFADLELGYRL